MKKFFLFVLSLCIAGTALPQTAEEIIQKSENLIKGESCHGTFQMTVVTPDYTRTLKMESWWKGNEKALIAVKTPKKEAGNKTLKIGNEMWNYLRNTETVVKIPPSMMLQSWNGSDFTNDDIVRESNLSDDYDEKLLAEEEINGERFWKIELKPKQEAAVVWGKLYYWVRKPDYIPSTIQYYDEKGNLIRELNFSDVKTLDGRKLPTVWTMYNKAMKGFSTTFRILSVEFDITIDDSIFSYEGLEKEIKR